MKNLFLFLFAIILLASCRNDSEDVIPNSKTYKVTFNVSNFTSEVTPLKSAVTGANYCHYRIYEKKSGKAVQMNSWELSTESIEVEIEAGSYYIAFFSRPRTIMSPDPNTPVNLENFNFYSDYCGGVIWINYGTDNLHVYYEKVAFNVGEGNSQEVEHNVTLQPMWSVLNIEVTDADTCFLPEGTNTVECTVNPFYYGFNIADGVPTENYEKSVMPEQSRTAVTSAIFQSKKGIFGKIISASKDVTVKLVFLERTVSDTKILGERVIYKGDLEGSKKITLKGTLGNASSSVTFNPTLGDLADGGIIPFE